MNGHLMTRDEYWESLEKRAALPRRAGVVLLVVVVVCAASSFVMWMAGVAFQPLIRWVVFASGSVFGVAAICLGAGFVLRRGRAVSRLFAGSRRELPATVRPIPRSTRSFIIVGFSLVIVLCVGGLAWAAPGIVSLSGAGEVLENPGQDLFWFGVYGLVDACAGFVVGVALGVVGAMAWMIREAVRWGRGSLDAPAQNPPPEGVADMREE